jgi:uncharacterized membrane protein YfcA
LTLTLVQYLLGIGSGALVGFVLGLVGGGGSILAVPLIVYLVGVKNPHLAIGTSALAVAANAATGLVHHARAGHVQWRCAGLFALLMIGVGVLMLRRRAIPDNSEVKLGRENAGKLVGYGLGTGAFAGFFGIGGGFLIVPGLIAATGMSMINAVGSSLVAVTAFGLTTAINYSLSGLVDWALAFAFIGGGFIGSLAGTQLAHRLSKERGRLATVFAVLIFIVAGYMLWKSAAAAWG